jgi:hypothetical protein
MSAVPRQAPWRSRASSAYDEHVGQYRQADGRPARASWYKRTIA